MSSQSFGSFAVNSLSGFGGAGVLEVVEDYRSDTFRCVYAEKFAGAVSMLHAFQKKSKAGIKTPNQEIEIVIRRTRKRSQPAGIRVLVPA